ncbi:hypothetical protein KAF25_008148 [Fusarium avenaceum]|uniref:Glucose-repressible protein n=1 Tax=Fusarium avenaceum TaxID=40199 RepID=A0A9P7H9T5_9HYPO|nr:hypothetical protein KAF25_008148 [Fusarium avenaceum]
MSTITGIPSASSFLSFQYLNPNTSHLQTSLLFSSSHSHIINTTLQTKPTPKQPTAITMESLKQAGNYVAETVQSVTAGASKEANKEVAKDSNVPISTRASAAKDALGDKIDETGHDKKADVHKEAAKQ